MHEKKKVIKEAVCDQKSTLFRFQEKNSYLKRKFDQIFKREKTCYRKNLPQNYSSVAW